MSTLLEQASLVLIPSGYKEDTVYSVVPSNGSGDMSFTRASDGTRINSDGLVENTPWNLLQQSNTFNTTWATSNATLTSGQAGYDGSINAWLLTTTLAGGFIYQGVAINGVTTLSIYAKAGSQNGIILYSAHTAQGRNFNLSTGTIGASFVAAPLDSIIESIGSGWYRCSITISSSSTNNFRIYISDGTNPSVGNAIIQNSQVNIGSTAKPYFPTTDRLNVPRLTYQNGGGGCPSLLLEPQRTNIITYSEQFDNIAWTKTGVTVTANNTTSPDGTQNADKMISINGASQCYVSCSNITTNGINYTLSAYVKKAGANWIQLIIVRSYVCRVWVNLTNGAIGTNNGNFTSVSVDSMGNDWYRISAVFPSITSAFALISLANGDNIDGFTGDGTSGAFIWGAQLEAGAYQSSYIPTVASSATRIADACSKTGIGSLFGSSYTLSGQFINQGINNTRLLSVKIPSGGSYDNFITIFQSGTGLTATGNDGSVVAQFTIASGSYTVGQTLKFALRCQANNVAFYINGTQIGTDVIATIPAVTAIFVGNYTDIIERSLVNQVVVFNSALTNSELATLTTI